MVHEAKEASITLGKVQASAKMPFYLAVKS